MKGPWTSFSSLRVIMKGEQGKKHEKLSVKNSRKRLPKRKGYKIHPGAERQELDTKRMNKFQWEK